MTARQPRSEIDVPDNFYPQDGAIYRHWKGALYSVLLIARVEGTEALVVVYQPFQGGIAWTRPIKEFGARFDYVNNLGTDPRENRPDRRISFYDSSYESASCDRRIGLPDRRGVGK